MDRISSVKGNPPSPTDLTPPITDLISPSTDLNPPPHTHTDLIAPPQIQPPPPPSDLTPHHNGYAKY